LKVKFLGIIVVASLIFVGCVSTKNVPVAESDIDDFRNRTVTVPKRGVPDFAAMTADKAAFGLIGAAMMISEGNRIIRENIVEDPANYISEQLVSALSDKYQLTPVDTDTSELESEDVEDISRVFKGADYVLDVRTINWSFGYFPTDFNNYRVMYSSKLRLIDTKKSIAIAEGFCARVPEQDEHAPSYDELLSNNAERLKGELKISADYCIDNFKKNIFGLQAQLLASGKMDNPQADKGDFVSTIESPNQFNTSHPLISELEVEKMRIADEEAQIERLRLELEQLKAESAQNEKTEKLKLASIPKSVTVSRISLRKKPMEITNQANITDMLTEYDFFERSKNPRGSFENVFIDNDDGTITDRATGLMWQKSGSSRSLENRGAKEYINKLNKEQFAGHSDWRMPTVEELASLIKKAKINGVHIDPVFDNKQIRCWTLDQCDTNRSYQLGAWLVHFRFGEISKAMWIDPKTGSGIGYLESTNITNYIKAVRSVR